MISSHSPAREFRLVGISISTTTILTLGGIALPLLVIAGFSTGTVTGGISGGIGMVFALLAAFLWFIRLNSRGTVFVSPEGVSIHSPLRRVRYEWKSVAAIEPSETRVIWPSHSKPSAKVQVLQIKLKRRGLFNILPFAETVLLKLDNPDAFLSATHRHLADTSARKSVE